MLTESHLSKKDTDINLANVSKLGVGLLFQVPLRKFVEDNINAFDFLEIIPDTLWNDYGSTGTPRYEEIPDNHKFLQSLVGYKPIIAHSIGLSIGTADRFDKQHIDQIAKWQQQYNFPWHSDHLSFNRLEHQSGQIIDVGFTMPIPYDETVLELLVERVNYIQNQISVPFLLENNVYYFEIPHQQMSEAQFLNKLTEITGCGLLLDLHNVYVNARNHGFNPWQLLDELDLTKVLEIHLAGGMMMDGFYLDAHSGICPEEVWQLLEEIFPQTPNLAGIVFEVFGTHFSTVGAELVKGELDRAKAIWNDHRG